MITPEILLLCGTAATIAFVHTLLGPDHYLPFVALAKSRGWSLGRTMRTTLLCGSGHSIGSVVLGFIGIYASIQLDALEWIEGLRGDLAGWAIFIVFVLGPCEPLIPILVFPAAKESVAGLVAVTAVFAVVTVLTMLAAVAVSVRGLQSLRLRSMERFSEAIAGAPITLCGLSIAVLGL